MLAKEVVDGCPCLRSVATSRARCVVRFQTLLEPIDVLLEVVEEVLDVDFPVRSAEDLVLEIAVEGVVELVAGVLEARDERFDVTVREAILREGGRADRTRLQRRVWRASWSNLVLVPEDYATALPRPDHEISARSCPIAPSGPTDSGETPASHHGAWGRWRLARAVPGRLSLVQNPESRGRLVQRPGSRLRTRGLAPDQGRTQDQRLRD